VALFSKKPAETSPEQPEQAPVDEIVHASRSYTPKKNKATPKRTVLQRRRAEPPPANRREALKRTREKNRETSREDRRAAYEGMKAGDERYLLPRDRGPERALVRDVVDSRRNAGTFFFGGAFLLLALSMVRDYRAVMAANLIWYLLAVAVVIDTVLISRRVKKLIKERFPKTNERMRSLYFYAFTRSIMFRRLRVPRPRVKVGEAI
jgi:Protein of unknown function (DUF3043)